MTHHPHCIITQVKTQIHPYKLIMFMNNSGHEKAINKS